MPCDFHYDSPHVSGRLLPGCQFSAHDIKLIEVDGAHLCEFHCPLVKRSGDATEKAKWTDSQKENFNERINRIINTASDHNTTADLTGVVFPGPFALSNRQLPRVCFQNALFSGRVLFSNIVFNGEVFFSGTEFSDQTEFERTQFKSHAIFEKAIFSGYTALNAVSFFSPALFTETQFIGDVVFGKATFHNDANFQWTQFRSEAEFGTAKFYRQAEFQEAQFYSNGSFDNTQFLGDAWFGDAQFHGHAWFRGAQFHHEAGFGAVQFGRSAKFDRVQFHDRAVFTKARFHGVTYFVADERVGTDQADMPANTFSEVDFRSAFFGSDVSFKNRRFLASTNFEHCRFTRAPVFHGCTLHQDTMWLGAEFMDKESPHAARAYRTLKLAMEQIRSRDEEAMFYAYEQQSRRRQPHTQWIIKVTSWFYEITSDYGRSVELPFVWLIASLWFFVYAYALLWPYSLLPVDTDPKSIDFAFQQLVRPFSVWGREGIPVANLLSWRELITLRLTATLHSILSLTFITLFLLAIRRRFKLS